MSDDVIDVEIIDDQQLSPREQREKEANCDLCLDFGIVIVWHWKTMIDMRKWLASDLKDKGPFRSKRGRWGSCGVRCTCVAGDQWRGVKVEYDEHRHCRCEINPTPQDLEHLEWHCDHEGIGVDWDSGDHP